MKKPLSAVLKTGWPPTTGTRLYEAGEHARAIVYLDRARGLLGEWDAVRHNRAQVLSALGRHQEAMEEWNTILARQPDWTGLLWAG